MLNYNSIVLFVKELAKGATTLPTEVGRVDQDASISFDLGAGTVLKTYMDGSTDEDVRVVITAKAPARETVIDDMTKIEEIFQKPCGLIPVELYDDAENVWITIRDVKWLTTPNYLFRSKTAPNHWVFTATLTLKVVFERS